MNRKGMVALMDAMIFVVLISLLSVTILSFDADDDEQERLDASEVCEHLLSTDMTGTGLLSDMGEVKYNMADVIAYAVSKESYGMLKEVESMAKELTMGKYQYSFRFTHGDKSLTLGEWCVMSDSSYGGEWVVKGGSKLKVEMQLS